MPGLRGALSVRVSDGQTDRIVTRYCRGLKFTKVAPGGHQALSFTMVLPRNTFNNLGPEDRVYVYDGRSGRTVIEGYLENPTPVDGPDGQQYEVSAVGGMALASDETRGLIYLSRDLGQFQKDIGAMPSSTMSGSGWTATAPSSPAPRGPGLRHRRSSPPRSSRTSSAGSSPSATRAPPRSTPPPSGSPSSPGPTASRPPTS
jgi:hypothetical protein